MLEERVLARCPSCRNTFSTDRSGRQDCPVCGKPLVVPDPRPGEAAGPYQAPGPDVGGHPAPTGTPWERRSELGLLQAWGSTAAQALLFRQSKRGFPATLAACAYSFAPVVLFAIPACGSTIGLVWVAVLTGIGLKDLHGMSAGGAAASVLLPYLVLCCATCGLGVLLAGTMMRALQP